ncbi:hypothetical protein F4820DRAFT_430582 [Hypoxylon rubiginosum]|uniref:Uncharacterized protein n=1 Tax=Hypoxylon rubiginosum TaxID=110542 RepID=A0ACB9YSP3_9PEZI|nr:hypothetical protein F4820DRAFT_430582 [Hypoxylon rubiginosum]
MPLPNPKPDFDIYVDQSCLNTPMGEEPPQSQNAESVDASILSEQGPEANDQGNTGTNRSRPPQPSVETESDDGVNMAEENSQESAVRPSIEDDHVNEADGEEAERPQDYEHVAHHGSDKGDDVGDSSILSGGTTDIHDQTKAEHSYPDFSESHIHHADDGGDCSSHHEATDEDVFSDKSPRSSMGSYDSIPEHSKAHKDLDNMTTITTRSPRISDISQYEKEYEKEEFIPTARGTPRPPFRTPSDVRAMQMSSPPSSVLGSPRATKRHLPTVSRLGTPTASAQYSPKRMSTPPRFKSRKEAPLVLLHVTLLPLRWVWGDLLNNLDTDELSDQAKTLRESWRILQDRIGDTVIERGILLGHPQNDYEVLEERLLEALELPFRRRARILECGHYIGPSNEGCLTEDEESEDEWGSVRSRNSSRRHWCGTCKSEIRYDSLGTDKIFRVKVYASNGLMKAGAWGACWKEMERVDAELEPIVELDVQEELVRLAATQQEREFTHHEEAEIAKEVAQQLEEEHQKEQADFINSRTHTHVDDPLQPDQEPIRSPISEEERRWRDEERLREIYGESPPPPSPRQPPSREPSVHPHQDSYVPPSSPSSPPPRQSSPEKTYEQESPKRTYQNASLPELLLQSVRVLMQDRKNIVIFALSIFVLMLALRNTPTPNEPIYEPVIHRMRDVPTVRRAQVVEAPQAPPVQVNAPSAEPFVVASSCGQPTDVMPQYYTLSAEPIAATSDFEEAPREVHEQHSPVDTPGESAPETDQRSSPEEIAPQPESLAPEEPEEPHVVPSQQHLEEPDSTLAEPDYEKSPGAELQQDTPESELNEATLSHEEPVDSLSHPIIDHESSIATSCSTVYEPCNTVAASECEPQSPTASQSEGTETEVVTEKKVVRVVHTVTQTEVETATETVKVTAAEAEATKQCAPLLAAEELTELFAEESVPSASPEAESLTDAKSTEGEVPQ